MGNLRICLRSFLVRATGAALLLLAISHAKASPDFDLLAPVSATTAASAADALDRFLVDKGLIDPAQEGKDGTLTKRVRDKASEMVKTAMNFIGVPYRRGGTSAEKGFDCSGFTRQVFELSLGLMLPRRADDQARATGLVKVDRDELKPGDLVFFNTLKRTFSHVGIYLGDGKFIHAPRPGGEVRVEDMRFMYWAKRFSGGRRPEPSSEQALVEPLAGLSAATPTLQTVH